MKNDFTKITGSEKLALEILREIAQHLSYDADFNGSAHTNSPYGQVSLSENSFWVKNVASLPADANGPLAQLVRATDKALRENAFSEGPRESYGSLSLYPAPGGVWERIQAQFASPPDVIADVVAPAIRARAQQP